MRAGRFEITTVNIDGTDRVLVAAPHPDDELIAAGLLMQNALAVGAQVHVLIITHGDAFGYTAPAGTVGRAPRLRRIKLGSRRSHESLRALARIGVPPTAVTFFGYPDRGLMRLWSHHWRRVNPYHSPFTSVDSSPYEGVFTPDAPYAGEHLLSDLVRLIERERPTMIVYPHPRDAHTDHTATYAFVTAALEELARQGHRWAAECRRYVYLVHRGGWPSPRGLNPGRVLRPPSNPVFLQERWEEVEAGPRKVAQKQAAILMYRSQFPLIGRFLLSFVGKNELFSRPQIPRIQRVNNDAMCMGAFFSPWPSQPVLPDPLQDTLTRQVERSADIATVRAVYDNAFLYVQIGFARSVVRDVDYRLSLYPIPRGEAIHFRLRPSGRVARKIEGMWYVPRDIVVRSRDSFLEVAIPGKFLAHDDGKLDSFFISVTTRYRGISVDRTGLHFVQTESVFRPEDGVVYAVATPDDLDDCASIFSESFSERIRQIFGSIPPRQVVRDVFHLCYQAEPDALIVALIQGRVIGYVFSPSSLRRIWRTAMGQRQLALWVRQWLRGRFQLGWAPWRLLLLDKFQFLRSTDREDLAVESRILSMAVAPQARRQGVGTGLMKQAFHRFRALGIEQVRLEVRPCNEAALRTYQKLGFQVVDRFRDRVGEWLIMLARL